MTIHRAAAIGRRRVAAHGTCSPRGFSLLELMIVLAILVSLAAITLPNLQRRFQRNELQEAGRLLQETLGELRQEALQSGRPLFVQFGWDSNRIRVFRDAAYVAQLPLGSEASSSLGLSGAGAATDRMPGLSGGTSTPGGPGVGLDGAEWSLQPWDVQEQVLSTEAWFSSSRLTASDAGATQAGFDRGLGVDRELSGGAGPSGEGGATASDAGLVAVRGSVDDRGPAPSGWSPLVVVLPDGRVQSLVLWLHLDRQWQCPILWRGATGQVEIGPAERVREAVSDSNAEAQL